MVADEIIVALAEKLGRERMLTEQESRWLEQALRRTMRAAGLKRGFWQAKDDVALKRHLRRGRTAKDIARAMGRSVDAVRSRIRVLRGNTGHRRKVPQGPMAWLEQDEG